MAVLRSHRVGLAAPLGAREGSNKDPVHNRRVGSARARLASGACGTWCRRGTLTPPALLDERLKAQVAAHPGRVAQIPIAVTGAPRALHWRLLGSALSSWSACGRTLLGNAA